MSEKIIKYQCCICKETVSRERQSSHLDPCALFVVSNIDESRDNQKEQQFFCHFECFRKIVNDDGNLYIMDDDFPTMAEVAQEDWAAEGDQDLDKSSQKKARLSGRQNNVRFGSQLWLTAGCDFQRDALTKECRKTNQAI